MTSRRNMKITLAALMMPTALSIVGARPGESAAG
jgi:hypothetical protein